MSPNLFVSSAIAYIPPIRRYRQTCFVYPDSVQAARKPSPDDFCQLSPHFGMYPHTFHLYKKY